MTRIQELNAKIKQVRAEARAQIAQLQAELASVRAERSARGPKARAKAKAQAQREQEARDQAQRDQEAHERAMHRMREAAAAAAEEKIWKARMAAAHPDHGGTAEAFRAAHAEWKKAQYRSAAYRTL